VSAVVSALALYHPFADEYLTQTGLWFGGPQPEAIDSKQTKVVHSYMAFIVMPQLAVE